MFLVHYDVVGRVCRSNVFFEGAFCGLKGFEKRLTEYVVFK